MKYVCIDDGAVNDLISGRFYQSIDFEEGDKLIKSFRKDLFFAHKFGNITSFQDKDGVFFTTQGSWKSKKYLVIDCEQSFLFTQLPSRDSLTSFQKLLRFCVKYWNKGVYNRCEKIITGTSKAVLFPLPHATDSPFRIVIEREPLKSRLQKREMDCHFLLVYKSAWAGADSANESADETNFRKVIERLPDIYKTLGSLPPVPPGLAGTQFASTELQAPGASLRPAHLPFRDWLPLLTARQREFVVADRDVPHRLQGPAGTGKTLSLMLRTIGVLTEAQRREQPCRALLVTHSEATREAIQDALRVIDPFNFQDRESTSESVSLSVETLASLCAKFLRQSISVTEFVDRDAQDSKILQEMYIEQSINKIRHEVLPSFQPLLSEELRFFFQGQSDAQLAPLFQHEISVLIKGRSGDSFDKYCKCPSLRYGLPIKNSADKGFSFEVFKEYQRQLESNSQFDTDDVVISAVGQLDTPIWRRRRGRDGYDFIAVDETHLFNINELHVFHHFSRDPGRFPISFTVDQAQAVGDRGWNDEATFDNLFEGNAGANNTTVTAVFRSAPAIRDFCHSILASGATLFTNFTNTLVDAQSAFTAEDERRSLAVEYLEYSDDDTMIEGAYQRAERLLRETDSRKSEVLITTLSDDLLYKLRNYADNTNKTVTVLERRGDFMQIKKAEKSGHFVLAHADFVGGLEFNAVVIVGVDKGRVPYEGETTDSNSRSFASYAAHNRLYVAASRAKYALCLLGERARGASDILRGAAVNGLVNGLKV